MAAARAKESGAKHPGGGNKAFTLTPEMEADALAKFEAEASKAHLENVPQDENLGMTQDDLELEEMLERMAKQEPISDHAPDLPVIPEKKTRDVLRNYVEGYKPATNMSELQEQIHQAKSNEIDSIEASPALVRHLWKKDFEYILKGPGYGIYHDIRVYIDGFFEKNKDADKITMEQKLFPKSSTDIAPIIKPQKI